jgi:ABC-2 type transport system permease protein
MSVVPLNPRSMVSAPPAPVRTLGPLAFARDTALITRRHLLRTWRTPQLIVLAAIMPIMFVLLFTYVFGGSIQIPGYASYVDYLIPGVIVQTVVFGGSSTAVGLADDLSKGLTDRFRSLPTHRASILAARTLADVIRLTLTMALLIAVGVLVGFRVHNDPVHVAAGLGIAVVFGAACSWMFALLALTVRHTETAQLAAFVITFPFVFASSAFTSTETMPSWLQTFADNQPVTKVVDAVRALMVGSGPAGHVALSAVLWSVGLLAVAAVLATWRFSRMS